MSEAICLGFTKWHWRTFKLRGLAKKLGVESGLLESWFSQRYGDPTDSRTRRGLARSFTCGPLIEFYVGHHPVVDPRAAYRMKSRWHIYRHRTANHRKQNTDAYFGNLHITWGGQKIGGRRHGERSIDELELCILPCFVKEQLDALKKELLVYKLTF